MKIKINNKTKVVVSVIFVLILVTLSAVRIYRVNKKYPDPPINTYKENDKIKGGNIDIAVKKSRIITMDDIDNKEKSIEEVILDTQNMNIDKNQVKFLIIDLEITNNDKNQQTIDLTKFSAESVGWANGWSPELYAILNNTDRITIQIEGNSKTSVRLPFTMYDFQFKETNWEDIIKRKFYLVLSLYPVKNQVLLEIQ